jgi:integrase
MNFRDIEKDPCVRDFIRSRSLRESTKDGYLLRINQYCKFIGKTPTELIDEAEEEQDQGIKTRKRKIKDYVLDYVEDLKNNNRSNNTIRTNLETIFGFYRAFDIDPPRLRNLVPSNYDNPSFEELPELKHVKQAIRACSSIRDRAIILLHFSSGMGSSEIRNLTCRNFIAAVDEYLDLDDIDKENMFKVAVNLKDKENLIGTWKIRRYKTNMPYITFNSPESTLAIVDYVFYRYKMNKLVNNMDDPLFVTKDNAQITTHMHQKMFMRLNDRVGFGKRTEKRRFFTSHMLRKLFTTLLYKSGVDKLAIDWMLGHKINPITEAYFKTNEKDLKKNYMKALNHLTLEKVKTRRIKSSEVKDIVRDLDKKEEEIKQLREENAMTRKIVEDLIETMKIKE